MQLSAAAALARQNREVCIPEVDAYCYGKIAESAGTVKEIEADVIADANSIYGLILEASEVLDNAMVPETDRTLLVTPAVYATMKLSGQISVDTNIGEKARIQGVIARLDGAYVVKVPSARLPEGVAFILAHKSATVAPTKLEDFRVHTDPIGISGALIEGRICYDAFVLNNKKMGIYVAKIATA